jgi:hypothetical protein
MKPRTTSATYQIGQCPACSEPLFAGLAIDVALSAPTVENGGTHAVSVSVNASPQIVGMAITHRCGGADYPPEAEGAK